LEPPQSRFEFSVLFEQLAELFLGKKKPNNRGRSADDESQTEQKTDKTEKKQIHDNHSRKMPKPPQW
jgi:hypothetical protein